MRGKKGTPKRKNVSLKKDLATRSTTFLNSEGKSSVEYKSINIGKQVWMQENLIVDKFQNGDVIQEINTAKKWKEAREKKQPAWCYYNFDKKNGDKYGKLYNWFAVNDSRGLAPAGWRIPKEEDWTTLEKSDF